MDLAMVELSQNPAEGQARASAGYFAARLGDSRRAQDEVEQALHSVPGDNTVIYRAILTYEALGLRERALAILQGATPDLIHSLENDPDLADFCHDSRFKKMTARN